MAAQPKKQPFLAPGNEAEWVRLNAEKREALRPAPDTPIGELLRRGQHLSAQGANLLRAVERAKIAQGETFSLRIDRIWRRIGAMAAQPKKPPLLAPGNEAEWARINEEESRQEAEFAASLSMADRVAYGQKLSQQAVSLLVASVKAGHAPERALWS